MGNLDRLGGIMSPNKTVYQLRSTPAHQLAQAPDSQLGVGADLSKGWHRPQQESAPCKVLTRPRYGAYSVPIPCLPGPDLTEVRTRLH